MVNFLQTIPIFIYIFILIFLPFRAAYALKSDDFLSHATEIIYKDCKGSVLQIPERSFLSALPPIAGSEILVPQSWAIQNPNLTDIKDLLKYLDKWSFPKKIFGEIRDGNYLEISDRQEIDGRIFRTRKGQIYRIIIDGGDLFFCGSKSLTIEGDEWSWNKRVIQLPRFQYESLITIKELAFIKVSIGGFEVNIWQIAVTGLVGSFGGSWGIFSILHRKRKRYSKAGE